MMVTYLLALNLVGKLLTSYEMCSLGLY